MLPRAGNSTSDFAATDAAVIPTSLSLVVVPTLVTLVIPGPSLVRFVFRFVTLVTLLRRLTLVRRLVTFATRHRLSWTWMVCLGSLPGRGLWRGALCRWLYRWVLSKNRLFLTFFVVVRRLFSPRRSCSVRRRSGSRSSFSWD